MQNKVCSRCEREMEYENEPYLWFEKMVCVVCHFEFMVLEMSGSPYDENGRIREDTADG